MRSSLSGSVVLVALAATSTSAFYGCASSPTSSGNGNPFGAAGAAGTTVGAAGSNPGSSGAPGASGSVGTAGAPSGGAATTTAGAGGEATTAGAGGASTAGGAGASTAGAGGGSAGGSPMGDITKVAPTAGCGMAPAGMTPGQTVKFTMQTSGTKPADCADSKCGAWSYPRDYYVTLPSGYVDTKAYPIVFEGPGCSSNGSNVYALTDPTANNTQNVNNTVIRVGLTPPPDAIGHATNPNQGCFDDKEGNSSVDWVFYENLYDKLAGQICFDKNRVFASGNSSGAWFSNELGCKYAGDPLRPVRGIMPNTGGLPTDTRYVPTCTNKPMAGMWVGETMDPENPFAGNVVAINRAITVNGCTGGAWGTTPTANYPIGGGKPDTTCKIITGCPALYPLVVCLIVGNLHQDHNDTTEPGFTTFLKFFSKPPQITQ